MRLGNFSVSLAFKEHRRSRAFLREARFHDGRRRPAQETGCPQERDHARIASPGDVTRKHADLQHGLGRQQSGTLPEFDDVRDPRKPSVPRPHPQPPSPPRRTTHRPHVLHAHRPRTAIRFLLDKHVPPPPRENDANISPSL